MQVRFLTIAILTTATFWGVVGCPPAFSQEDEKFLVSAIDDVEVPAREAGVLTELPAKPGQQVEEGHVLGKVDDDRARIADELAEITHDKAKESAENDINVRYAKAASDVADAELERAKAANRRTPGSISDSEMRTKELEAKRAELQIEQAIVEQQLLEHDVRTAYAEWKAARKQVTRRQVTSPIDGEVFEVHRNRGEWVEAGEPVLRVVRMNRLQIQGFLKEADWARAAVIDRPITVKVTMDGGRVETFKGKIVFASSETTGTSEFKISAEVDNRKENGRWLLKPGQSANVTIE